MQNSTFNVEASKVIHGIVTFSPAPESVSLEFLNELGQVDGLEQLVQLIVKRQTAIDSKEWAGKVLDVLSSFTMSELAERLRNVTSLASEYLSHLLIATRNAGGKKTPQESSSPTFDIHRALEIRQLLDDARVNRDQAALKELLYRRDGYICPLSGYLFNSASGAVVRSKTAHILPFACHNQHITLQTIERFTGHQITADVIAANINDPRDAFNVEGNAHEFYDNLSRGIEAKCQPDGTYKYFYRTIRSCYPATVKLKDGDEIVSGNGAEGHILDPPDPAFCNLKFAIARVMHATGASEIIEQPHCEDEDDSAAIMTCPVFLGGPCVSDGALFRRLHSRLSVQLSVLIVITSS